MAPQTNKGKLEESMMMSKAALMEHSIELQKVEGVEKQLLLMERFKSSFVQQYNRDDGNGEAEYNSTVCDLIGELPFMKKRKGNNDASNDEGE